MGRGRLISTAFVARPRHEVNARACKITGNGMHQEHRRSCTWMRQNAPGTPSLNKRKHISVCYRVIPDYSGTMNETGNFHIGTFDILKRYSIFAASIIYYYHRGGSFHRYLIGGIFCFY